MLCQNVPENLESLFGLDISVRAFDKGDFTIRMAFDQMGDKRLHSGQVVYINCGYGFDGRSNSYNFKMAVTGEKFIKHRVRHVTSHRTGDDKSVKRVLPGDFVEHIALKIPGVLR